jgi:hypothetical protein
MNIGLWIGQALLAGVFLFSAISKGFWSKEKLIAKGQTGVAPVSNSALATSATF